MISLINSIVSEEDQVLSVELLNPQNFKNDKWSVLDIKAKGHDGKRYNIEIQISDAADYDKRALYYWAKLYSEQLESGMGYSSLNKTIGIHILNFTSIPETERYHNVFRLHEEVSKIKFFKDIELHTIELNKFENIKKDLGRDDALKVLLSKVKSTLDMWIMFLTRHDLLNKEKLPKELDNSKLSKALSVLEVINFSKEERDSYEDHLKWLRDEMAALEKAESKGFDKGFDRGFDSGMERGKVIIKGIIYNA